MSAAIVHIYEAVAGVKDGTLILKPKSNTPRLAFTPHSARSLIRSCGGDAVRVRVTVEVLEGAKP